MYFHIYIYIYIYITVLQLLENTAIVNVFMSYDKLFILDKRVYTSVIY